MAKAKVKTNPKAKRVVSRSRTRVRGNAYQARVKKTGALGAEFLDRVNSGSAASAEKEEVRRSRDTDSADSYVPADLERP